VIKKIDTEEDKAQIWAVVPEEKKVTQLREMRREL
jgi:hypothetical protein